MSVRDSRQSWGGVSIALHWASAVIVLATLGIGLGLDGLEHTPLEATSRLAHESLGLLVLALTALRLLWRLANPRPEPAAGTPAWQAALARTVHLTLLGLIIALPLSGWVMQSAAGRPVAWLGLVTLPPLAAPDRALHHLAGDAHEALAWVLVVLIAIHVAAALGHHLASRDGTLRRMLGRARA